MADRKKVIKGLETCYRCSLKCEDCPYNDLLVEQSCNEVLCLDALALIREHEQTIKDLKEKLRLLDYGNHYYIQDILMPAT